MGVLVGEGGGQRWDHDGPQQSLKRCLWKRIIPSCLSDSELCVSKLSVSELPVSELSVSEAVRQTAGAAGLASVAALMSW